VRCVGVRRSRSACEAACENLLGCSGPPRTVEAPPATKRVCALHSGAGSRGEQVYTTPELLATRVAAMARAYAPANATFVELGVGDGAIYKWLPVPRVGVELREVVTRHDGVAYGESALAWTPPCDGPLCVVMNPPFGAQVEWFNRAASLAPSQPLTLVWIAGLNVRLWSIEDTLDDRMELAGEWHVHRRMSSFHAAGGSKFLRCCVQVWRRLDGDRRRALWRLPRSLPGFKPVYAEPLPRGCLVVARTAYAGQVGKAGVLGESAYLDGEAHLALTEVEASDAPSAPTASLGTLRRGHGTAMVLRADDVAEALRVAARLAELQRSGVLYDLLRERTSLTYGTISAPVIAALMERGPEALARPLASLDDVQFVPSRAGAE